MAIISNVHCVTGPCFIFSKVRSHFGDYPSFAATSKSTKIYSGGSPNLWGILREGGREGEDVIGKRGESFAHTTWVPKIWKLKYVQLFQEKFVLKIGLLTCRIFFFIQLEFSSVRKVWKSASACGVEYLDFLILCRNPTSNSEWLFFFLIRIPNLTDMLNTCCQFKGPI